MVRKIDETENLFTNNIYFGMYSTTHNKESFEENTNRRNVVTYTITRFGILYRFADKSYIDIIEEDVINNTKIDFGRLKSFKELDGEVDEKTTVHDITEIVRDILNVQSDRDYIETAERIDNIHLGPKSSMDDGIFEMFVQKYPEYKNRNKSTR